jgi:uncharacterized coiled-coil protein SlyX
VADTTTQSPESKLRAAERRIAELEGRLAEKDRRLQSLRYQRDEAQMEVRALRAQMGIDEGMED